MIGSTIDGKYERPPPRGWGIFPSSIGRVSLRALDEAHGGRIRAASTLAWSLPHGPGMANTSVFRSAIAAGLFIVTGGCAAMRPPAQTGGPARSEKGIQLAVLRQSCSQTQEPDQYGWDLVEETVEVQLRNLASEPATVHRDKFRLLTPDGYALSTRTWGAADPLQVAAGANSTFELRFQTHGSLECGKEMRLDPDAGITLRESPVALQPLSFVPQRAL
jgi:hypothetical protein